MAQYRKDTQQFLNDCKTIFEVSMLGNSDGSVISNTNPIGVMTNNENILAAPWQLHAARGKIAGVSLQNIYGYNPNVGSAWVPIWENTTAYTFPSSSGETMVLYSSSASDTNVSVLINGLDNNYNIKSETLILTNGTTGVNTVNSYMRINSMYITGTNNPVGNIILGNLGKTLIYAQINNGVGRTQMTIYTVPSGYTFYLDRVNISADGTASGKAIYYRISTINSNGIIGQVVTSPFPTTYETVRITPNPYPEKTTVQWQCSSPSQTVSIGLRIEGLLIQNSLL